MSPQERVLTGWGRTAPSRAFVDQPVRDDDVRAALEHAPSRGVLPRGLGRSYGDVAQNAGGLVLDMTSFAVPPTLDEAAGTIRAGAGSSFDELLHLLVPRGWFLPVVPGTRFVTLGGAIANDVHGKNHHVDGSIARHLVSFELVTPGGELRTVTPESDARTWTATLGGIGLTGVILRATLRVRRIGSSRVRVDTERARDLDDLMSRMASGDEGYRYSVAWIDCLARGSNLGRGVLTRGDHAAVSELGPSARRAPLAYRSRSVPPVPPVLPSVMSLVAARTFNEIWYRRAPREERGALVGIDPFFFPLDAVPAWNRLYGRRGFVQHQSVVPFGSEQVIVDVIERIAALGRPSFLGVLKRFGDGGGMLSFPMPGWTLALDFPAAASGIASVLDEIDRRVADSGGRVYLGKDARLAPALLPVMYPEFDRWAEVRASLDPAHAMRSDLERRLDLWSRSRRRLDRKLPA
jgi:decaprenylphospho-beta-D-ribofuranose 2-oxidase